MQRARRDEAVDDEVLAERVRAALGHHVSHPRAIDVSVRDGAVTLGGHVLTAESQDAQAAVRRVRGVRDVVNLLAEHDEPGSEPSLQGGRTMHRRSAGRWVPATRLLTGAGSIVFAAYGLRHLTKAGSTRRAYDAHW
jgi:hypothetical protein